MNARTQNRQLSETAGAQGRLLDGQLVDHIAIRGVHLVHQWCRSYSTVAPTELRIPCKVESTVVRVGV